MQKSRQEEYAELRNTKLTEVSKQQQAAQDKRKKANNAFAQRRAQELAAAEAHESLEAAADRGTMRPLTAATAVKQQRERQDAQPGMVWSQDWRSALHGGAPGWRVLTPAENALRARGSLSRAGL